MMRATFLFVLCTSLIFLGTGCQTEKSKAVEGAVIGGLVGATGGGIIGHQRGRGLEGAGIGAAAGALTGAIIGSQIPKSGQQDTQATSAAGGSSYNQMTLQQIVDLSKQGVHEDVIIDKIRLTNSKFQLTNEDINYLKQQGVSQKVINVMQGM